MKTLLMAFLLLLGGCDFDEEFEDSDNFQTEPVNRSYEASLASTDVNVPGITGTSKIDVEGEVVRVQVSLQGVPQNITQIHYGYIASDCSVLQNLVIPNDPNGTRSVNINEDSTLTALQNDVLASGAAVATQDSNLESKSLVIKAFSTFSDPNTIGTNSLIIACGPINITGSDDTEVVGPVESSGPVGAATIPL